MDGTPPTGALLDGVEDIDFACKSYFFGGVFVGRGWEGRGTTGFVPASFFVFTGPEGGVGGSGGLGELLPLLGMGLDIAFHAKCG